jgi:hypothetical protein
MVFAGLCHVVLTRVEGSAGYFNVSLQNPLLLVEWLLVFHVGQA